MTSKLRISESAWRLLGRMMDGPIEPYRHEWMTCRALETAGYALKHDMKVYATDVGRVAFQKREERGK